MHDRESFEVGVSRPLMIVCETNQNIHKVNQTLTVYECEVECKRATIYFDASTHTSRVFVRCSSAGISRFLIISIA